PAVGAARPARRGGEGAPRARLTEAPTGGERDHAGVDRQLGGTRAGSGDGGGTPHEGGAGFGAGRQVRAELTCDVRAPAVEVAVVHRTGGGRSHRHVAHERAGGEVRRRGRLDRERDREVCECIVAAVAKLAPAAVAPAVHEALRNRACSVGANRKVTHYSATPAQ